MSLKDLIKKVLNLGKDEVYRVDVKDSFAFFNTDADIQDLVLTSFKGYQIDGRSISVEVSKNPESGSGRKRRNKGGHKYGDKRGGRRSDSFKPRGKSGRKGKKKSKKRDGFY